MICAIFVIKPVTLRTVGSLRKKKSVALKLNAKTAKYWKAAIQMK